jgi:hypothetical protein
MAIFDGFKSKLFCVLLIYLFGLSLTSEEEYTVISNEELYERQMLEFSHPLGYGLDVDETENEEKQRLDESP